MGFARNCPGKEDSRSISSTLLFGIQHQEPGAWERLYRIWGPVVYHRFRRVNLPPQDAEDLLQTVFMKVAQHIGQFHRGRFRAWIYQIMDHTLVDYFRSRHRFPAAQGGTGNWFSDLPAPNKDQSSLAEQSTAAFAGPSPDDSSLGFVHSAEQPDAELTEKVLLVRQTLRVIRTDFEQRTFQAFWRTAVDGLTSSEVGRELGMSPEAVRIARYRVLKRLRQELEGML